MDMETVGKFVVLMGISLTVVGALMWFGGRLGVGALPGTLKLGGENWSCFVPIGASIVISLLLTLVLNFLLRFLGK